MTARERRLLIKYLSTLRIVDIDEEDLQLLGKIMRDLKAKPRTVPKE